MSTVNVQAPHTTATLAVDVEALVDQLDEVVEMEQFAADTYAAHANSLPEDWMRGKAEEFRAGAIRGRDAATELMRLIGAQPTGTKRGLASAMARAKGLVDTGRSGRFGQLKNLQDMLVAAFLTAGEWAMVQWAAYGIGDPRFIEVAEREVELKSLPVQWLLVTTAERTPWAITKPASVQ